MDIRNVLYMAGMVILTAMLFVAVLTTEDPKRPSQTNACDVHDFSQTAMPCKAAKPSDFRAH